MSVRKISKIHAETTLGRFRKGVNSKRTFEQLIEDVLFKDDMILLDIICDSSSVVGDKAALWSKGILKILNSGRIDRDNVQEFLKRALRNRILDYRAKSRDLSDITRDNSLVTMMLTAYARNEGQSFLSQTLTKPLNSIYPILSKCEVDPQKLTKGQTISTDQEVENLEKEITTNRLNLEQVCEKVFQTIFESRDKLPLTILAMCCFLTDTIEEINQIDPSTLERKVRSPEEAVKAAISHHPSASSPLISHGRASISIFRHAPRLSASGQPTKSASSSFSNQLSNMLKKKKPHGSKDNLTTAVPSPELSTASKASRPPSVSERGQVLAISYSSSSRQLMLPGAASSLGKLAEREHSQDSTGGPAPSPVRKTSLELAMPIPLPPSLTDGLLDNLSNVDTYKLTSIDHPKDDLKTSSIDSIIPKSLLASPKALKPELKSTGSLRPDKPIGSSRSRAGSGANSLASVQAQKEDEHKNSGLLGTLALSEKIIGSFLFLRFIVPGITSPDANGIMMEKITPAVRRGLVLCGKMMTALCNDTEFGYKETSLMPCNPFLEKYRLRMKEFLYKSAQMVQVPKPVLSKQASKSDGDLSKVLVKSASGEVLVSSSSLEVKSSPISTRKAVPSSSEFHNRAASHPLPETDGSINHTSPLSHHKSKTFSRSMEQLKVTSAVGGSGSDLDKVGTAVDPEIRAFYQSLGTMLDKLEKDISAKRPAMADEAYQSLGKSYGELRVYLNTGGYVEESDLTFKAKKSWWVKMVGFLGKH